MYTPKHFEQSDIAAMHSLIETYPLATLITTNSAGVCANHVPMHLSRNASPYGVLSGHIPRANPLSKEIEPREADSIDALMIFNGPSCYISPSWYASKAEHGKVVPTWNYTAVHARGKIRLIDDADWVLQHLTQLTDEFEASFAQPWAITDAPAEFIESLLRHLVGFEMIIETLEGKWKVSQNRPPADRAGVIAGLQSLSDSNAQQMADLIRAVE